MRVCTLVTLFLLIGGPAHSWWFDEWTGFVYPDRNNLTQHIEIGTFRKLEECRNAAILTMRNNGWATKGDFEFGLNCNSSTMPMICKETSR